MQEIVMYFYIFVYYSILLLFLSIVELYIFFPIRALYFYYFSMTFRWH